MVNYYYLLVCTKTPLFSRIVGYIKNLKKFLKIVDISLNSVIIYKCQGGPDTKYIIIHQRRNNYEKSIAYFSSSSCAFCGNIIKDEFVVTDKANANKDAKEEAKAVKAAEKKAPAAKAEAKALPNTAAVK